MVRINFWGMNQRRQHCATAQSAAIQHQIFDNERKISQATTNNDNVLIAMAVTDVSVCACAAAICGT
jgi:hypothetical protein